MRRKFNRELTDFKKYFRPFVQFDLSNDHYLVLGVETFKVPHKESKAVRQFGLTGMNLDRINSKDLKTPILFKRFLEIAEENGWLYQPSPDVTAYSCSEATTAIQNAIVAWKFGIINQDLGKMLKNSRAAQCAYLVEITWFVSQAATYLKSAASSSKNKKIKSVFKKWSDFEGNHYLDLIKDLDISAEEILHHDPCHGSISLVAYLHFLATKRPASFAVSMSLFEAELNYKSSVLSQYRSIEKNLGMSLKHFKKHYTMDLDAQHQAIWEQVVSSKRAYTSQELAQIITDIHTTRHVLFQWLGALVFRLKTAQIIGSNLKKPLPKHFIRSRIRPESLLAEATR